MTLLILLVILRLQPDCSMTDVEGPRFEPDAADLPSVVLSQVDDPSKWTGDLLAVCVTEDDFKEQGDLISASSVQL